MSRRPPPPPRRRRRPLPTAEQIVERERPFDPEVPPERYARPHHFAVNPVYDGVAGLRVELDPPVAVRSAGNTSTIDYGSWREDHRGEWFVPDRTSGARSVGGFVNKVNFETFIERFQVRMRAFYVEAYGAHDTYAVVLRLEDTPAEVWEFLQALESYPVADDEALSRMQAEAADEAWDDWGRQRWQLMIEQQCKDADCTDVAPSELRAHFEEVRRLAGEEWEPEGEWQRVTVDMSRVWYKAGDCGAVPDGCGLGRPRVAAPARSIGEILRTPWEDLTEDELRELMRHWALPEDPLPTYLPRSRPRLPKTTRSAELIRRYREKGWAEGYVYNPRRR